MTTEVLTAMKKNLLAPDETRRFENGKMDLVHLGDVTIGRITLQPGWRWSKDIQPLAKTSSCRQTHTQYVISGRLVVVMDDGTQLELHPGDAAVIPPGHEAWVIGDDPFVAVDFTGMKDYATESHEFGK